MYPVSANFHTLAIADSPKTRCRIYFISDAANCWDDNDVQTNGTLLVGAVGDTDSNGRIGQGGVTVTEIFNKDKNLTIGGTVSYQIGMTIVNSDGALNNFAFGRCKVYLDVYDDANSTWLPCPLGVFRIELPVKRKVQLITATGYDQMQVLSAIADTWWNGLDFTGGLTIENILNSMVTELGLHLSSASSSAMVNSSLSFTSAPFDSVERTYRDVLNWIAEATGTIARFNRDGELDMRQFVTPQINNSNIVIDTDTTGNQCFSIDITEYVVDQIDGLVIKLSETDQGVETGSSGTRNNKYTIWDNPFLYGASVAEIRNKLWPIYARLNQYGRYNPISIRIIEDWSIEAGDVIYITRDSTTYRLPIFQQKMVWRGGYVISELISTGDKQRPKASAGNVRETYRYDCEMATKVGDSEIISKINQSPEAITIQASKVNLTGYITATNLATAGQTVINGGNITTGSISADRISGGTLIVGGQNNVNGTIIVKNANGTQVGSISNIGVSINAYNDNRIAMQMGRYQNGGAYLFGYGSSGSPTVEIDSQYGTLNLKDANGIRRVETSGDTGFFAIRDKNGANQITVHSDPDQANFGSQFDGPVAMSGPVTMNSTLDVTQRRCYDTLSSAGWYRVLTYTGTSADDAIGKDGRIFDINITRTYNNGNNEVHSIRLLNPYNVFTFADESSRSNGQFIDKIRVMYNSSTYKTHVDIHYTHTLSNTVTADFTMHGYPSDQSKCVAAGLSGVGTSPAGESEMALYTFAANGSNIFKTVTLSSQSISSGYFIYQDAAITANSKLQISQYYKSGEALGMFFILQPRAGDVVVYCRTGSGALPADNSTISVFLTIDNR